MHVCVVSIGHDGVSQTHSLHSIIDVFIFLKLSSKIKRNFFIVTQNCHSDACPTLETSQEAAIEIQLF